MERKSVLFAQTDAETGPVYRVLLIEIMTSDCISEITALPARSQSRSASMRRSAKPLSLKSKTPDVGRNEKGAAPALSRETVQPERVTATAICAAARGSGAQGPTPPGVRGGTTNAFAGSEGGRHSDRRTQTPAVPTGPQLSAAEAGEGRGRLARPRLRPVSDLGSLPEEGSEAPKRG